MNAYPVVRPSHVRRDPRVESSVPDSTQKKTVTMRSSAARADDTLGGSFTREGRTVRNWNRVVQFDPWAVRVPANLEAYKAAVAEAAAAGRKVRIVGAGHSMNDSVVADRDAMLVQTVQLDRVGHVEQQANGTHTVWVEPGVSMAKLGADLSAQGYALETVPTSTNPTVGGALSGVHGSSMRHPSTIAEQVAGMEVLVRDGSGVKVQTVAAEDLPVARINLGSMGPVYRVQLRVVPNFALIAHDDEVSLDDALEPTKLRAYLVAHDNQLFFAYDQTTNTVVRHSLDRVPLSDIGKPDANGNPIEQKVAFDVQNDQLMHWVSRVAAWLPAFAGISAAYNRMIRRQAEKPADKPRIGEARFMLQNAADHSSHDMSYGIAVDDAKAAVQRISAAFKAMGYEPILPLAIRFLKGTEDTHLAMNSGRDTAVIELLSPTELDDNPTNKAEWEQARNAFEHIMRDEFGGRPHWQKEFFASPHDAYPDAAWAKFAALQARLGADLCVPWADRVSR